MTQGPERTAPAALVPPAGDRSLQIIFDCLLNEYSLDFSRYKPATMSRRMWRRLGIFGLQHLGDYVQALHASPQERHALARDLLERFFGKEQNRYRVPRQLCDMVHFIPHNLMQDPPFTHCIFHLVPKLSHLLENRCSTAHLGMLR
jgi:chemotaxis methyl-accepting protein methylase